MMISRRNFLASGFCGAAGLYAFSHRKALAELQIRLSACDWSFQVKSDPEGLVAAKAVGLDGLEISATDEIKETLRIADPEYRNAYKAVVEKTGVAISSIAMGHLNEAPVAGDDRAVSWLEQTIDAASDLNVKVLLLAFFGKGDLLEKKGLLGRGGALKQGDVDVVVERLKAVTPHAEKAGVILGLENTLSGKQNLAILERVQSDAVRVYYDVGNSTYNGYDVPAEIRDLNDRICQIHFKDGGFALGEGKVDMDAVAAAMRDIRYNGWVVLETAIQNQDRDASFKKNADYARKLFATA